MLAVMELVLDGNIDFLLDADGLMNSRKFNVALVSLFFKHSFPRLRSYA